MGTFLSLIIKIGIKEAIYLTLNYWENDEVFNHLLNQ